MRVFGPSALGRLTLGLALAGLVACSGKTREIGRDADDGAAGAGASSGEDAGGAPGSGATSSGGTGVGAAGSGAVSNEAGAGSGGTPDVTSGGGLDLDGAPIYTRAQRLTNAQWERAVTDILRLPAPPNQAQNFEVPVAGLSDFTNNERVLTVTNSQFASYELAAETVSALATGSTEALAALAAGDDADTFVRTFGRRAFRRPLSEEEVQRYLAMFARGEELYGAGFASGAGFVVRTMLQSPHFLYRTELGPAGEPLTGYEMASKLSFWLLGTTPSDALLDAAAAGELDTEAGAEATARTMLEQPSALEMMRDLMAQWLRLNLFATITKPGVPEYTEALNLELEQASHAFFEHLYRENLGLRALLTTTTGFVGAGTAPLYGVEPPASGLEARDLGPSRLGYFTQVPFLALNAMNAEPDSIRRGLAIHVGILCGKLPPALPGIPPIPELEADQTNRERITALTAGCGGDCHNVFVNPLGFAFENFDGLGRERSLDNGQPVDTTGAYPFSAGALEFSGASELMQILADEPQAHLCYAKKLSGYALQRDIVESDRALLDTLAADFTASTKAILLSLVRNPAFRHRPQGAP
jgi:hypothetical protein